MAGDLEPVRPVHPSWPSRPVPEDGERRRGPPVSPKERDQGGHGSGQSPGGEYDPPADAHEPAPEKPNANPLDDDPTGHHVDEYV